MAEYNIPGIYSEVDASAAVTTGADNANVIGIVATSTSGEFNKAYAPFSYDDAVTRYGADSNIVKLMAVASRNGGSKFITVRAEETLDVADYDAALKILALEEAVNIVIFDSTDKIEHDKLRQHCVASADNGNERIAFVGHAVGVAKAVVETNAKALNSGRVYTAFPNLLDSNGDEVDGIFVAAALAGAVAKEKDPALPMTGVRLEGFYGVAEKLEVLSVDQLIVSGVIPLKSNSGVITIVRAVSTYTKNGAAMADITWQELTTQRISDYVMKDMRARLASKYSRSKNTISTRNSIKSDVVTALLEYEASEYIEDVDSKNDASINVNPNDPTRSDVKFKYDVVSPLNVIKLTGHLVI